MNDSFLQKTYIESRAEICRQIITQNNPQFIRSILQFINLYTDINVPYTYSYQSEPSTINLVGSNKIKNPYQKYTTLEITNPTVTVKWDTTRDVVTLSGDGFSYRLVHDANNGVDIPEQLGLMGSIPYGKNGTIQLKIKYPASKIVKLLDANESTYLFIESQNLVEQYQTADSDLEKVTIVALALLNASK